MSDEAKYMCPLCEETMDVETCEECSVPTIECTLFDKEDKHVEPGTTFGGSYRIESVLGEGGMGTVYLATQISMNRPVALKTLLPDLITDAKNVKRFYQEAQAASQLNHPNIVRIFDFGIDNDSRVPFIAMEFLEGQTLGELIEDNGPLTERRGAELLAQTTKALVEAHSKGVVHRDLKPDNIHVRQLPDGDEHVKVLDFGIAKVVSGDEEQENLTATGMTLGTPLYMSPEQIMGELVDYRSDIYALGCILHETFAGAPPFSAEERLGVLVKHMSDEPPGLPAALVDGQPPSASLIQLRECMLAKKREHRPATTAVVARILNALSRGQEIDAQELLLAAQEQAGEAAGTPGAAGTTAPRIEARTSSPVTDAATVAGPSLASSDTVAAPAMTDQLVAAQKAAGVSDTSLEQLALGQGKSKTLPMIAAAAVVLLLGGLGFMFAGGDGASAGAEDNAARPAAPAATPAAPAAEKPVAPKEAVKPPEPAKKPEPPAKKSFTVNSQPPSDVYEGGVKVGNTPFVRKLAADDSPAFLELRKEGFKTKSVTVNPNGKVDQTFDLEADAPKKAAPVRAKVRRKSSAPKKAPAPKKKPKTEIPTW